MTATADIDGNIVNFYSHEKGITIQGSCPLNHFTLLNGAIFKKSGRECLYRTSESGLITFAKMPDPNDKQIIAIGEYNSIFFDPVEHEIELHSGVCAEIRTATGQPLKLSH